MIKCEECPSFAICVHKIKVIRYPHRSDLYTVFDTTELDNCIHFCKRFEFRDRCSNRARNILKRAILQAKGLL
jgi:hypothetical protein